MRANFILIALFIFADIMGMVLGDEGYLFQSFWNEFDGYYPDGPFYNDIGLFKEAIMTFELVDIMKTVETKFADE